jgi:hypothetical protein
MLIRKEVERIKKRLCCPPKCSDIQSCLGISDQGDESLVLNQRGEFVEGDGGSSAYTHCIIMFEASWNGSEYVNLSQQVLFDNTGVNFQIILSGGGALQLIPKADNYLPIILNNGLYLEFPEDTGYITIGFDSNNYPIRGNIFDGSDWVRSDVQNAIIEIRVYNQTLFT